MPKKYKLFSYSQCFVPQIYIKENAHPDVDAFQKHSFIEIAVSGFDLNGFSPKHLITWNFAILVYDDN